jgi:hypothetical protein
MQGWMSAHSPYASDLNPIQALWGAVKSHRSANYVIDDLHELESRPERYIAAAAA